MKARRPSIDFQKSLPRWSHLLEFAQTQNAASTTLPHLEPYLNRVVGMARDRLPKDCVELSEQTRIFMQQEANHYRLHKLYNERLHAAGYEGLLEHEARLRADYDRFLATKSLRFNMAYSEGFECLGIIYTGFFFEEIDDLLADADPDVALLWKWHLAEEFEHRTVCFDLYQTLFGGYWYRLYGFFYAFLHLGIYGHGATGYMLSVDRARMNWKQRLASRWRNLKYQTRLSAYALPRMFAILLPNYDPRRRREPRGVGELLTALATP
jgi:predicted metal-dependent hydrolase